MSLKTLQYMEVDTRTRPTNIRPLTISVLVFSLIDIGIKMVCNGVEIGWAGWVKQTPVQIARERVLRAYIYDFGFCSIDSLMFYCVLIALIVITAIKFTQNRKAAREEFVLNRHPFGISDMTLLLLTWLTLAGSFFVPLKYTLVSVM